MRLNYNSLKTHCLGAMVQQSEQLRWQQQRASEPPFLFVTDFCVLSLLRVILLPDKLIFIFPFLLFVCLHFSDYFSLANTCHISQFCCTRT